MNTLILSPAIKQTGFTCLGCANCGGACKTLRGLGCACSKGMGGLEEYVGKFVRSVYPVYLYKEPGQAAFATRKANSYIGKIAALNSKGNWAKLTDGNWIYFADPSIFTFKAPDTLTPEQIKDAKATAFNVLLDTTVPGGQVLNVAADIAQGAADTLDFGAQLLSFLGKNLKWIAIAGLGLVAYKVYNDVKPILKTKEA